MSVEDTAASKLDIQLPASTTEIIKEGVSTVRRAPTIVAVYLVVVVAGVLSQSLSNLLSLIIGGVAVTMAYTALEGRPENQVSFGVRLVIVFIAGLIAGVIVLIGAVFLIIPGIYLAVRLRLVTAAVMLEDCGPIEALSRSFELTDGHAWTIFGVTFLLGVVSFAITIAVGLVLAGVPSSPTDLNGLEGILDVGSVVPSLLIAPIGTAADAVMYELYGPRSTSSSASETRKGGELVGGRR